MKAQQLPKPVEKSVQAVTVNSLLVSLDQRLADVQTYAASIADTVGDGVPQSEIAAPSPSVLGALQNLSTRLELVYDDLNRARKTLGVE